ncbi:hypothetical protein L7F22_045804 [Adiantum nelumboides]|nr:hypothetical protein [Adiantum nelumboides]
MSRTASKDVVYAGCEGLDYCHTHQASGPGILSLKSFSSLRYWDAASSIHQGRQAELQFVWEVRGALGSGLLQVIKSVKYWSAWWTCFQITVAIILFVFITCKELTKRDDAVIFDQEFGGDLGKRLEQLQQSVSAAVHYIYESATRDLHRVARLLNLKFDFSDQVTWLVDVTVTGTGENIRRKADSIDLLAKSETQLKELLGPLEVMASLRLPLQTQLSMNTTRLKAMENVAITEYGWVGGQADLVTLHHRIVAFNEMFKLPPCENADLDKMLARTNEDRHYTYPTKAILVRSTTLSKTKQKTNFFQDAQKVPNFPHFLELPLQIFLEKDSLLRWSTKCSSSEIRSKAMENIRAELCYEALALHQLTDDMSKKLKKINRQTNSTNLHVVEVSSPFLPCAGAMDFPFSRNTSTLEDLRYISLSMSHSQTNASITPCSILPESSVFTPTPGYCSEDQPGVLDFCLAAQYASDLQDCRFKEANFEKLRLAVSLKPNMLSDVAAQPRTGSGYCESVAEALAAITRKSADFINIEDDVHEHAKSILAVKSRLETVQTIIMHAETEAYLVQVMDESQVFARFQGFKKLETVRAAASLHFKLTSVIQQIKKWTVEPLMSDQVEKVNAFFDKVKRHVESIERTINEDFQCYSCHKFPLHFEIMVSIKEVMLA